MSIDVNDENQSEYYNYTGSISLMSSFAEYKGLMEINQRNLTH